ncbi:hypothetical protein BHE74_00021840 [Ensete ventricosum]|nr:hypothetical protein GW17_00002010 [Ensete ventricosum]RWW70480.1 hypothetical protein BHE74_00021840 [Ensete ventricosum]
MTCSSFPEIKFNNSDVPRGHANSTIFNRGGCPIATKPPASYQERVSGPLANCTTPNPAGVYPLYYSDNQPAVVSCPSFQIIRGPRHHLATDTTHCAESHGEAEIHFAVSPIGNRNTIGASRGDSSYMETSKIGWDLSLRLGLPSPPSFEESTWTNDHEDAGSSRNCKPVNNSYISIVHKKQQQIQPNLVPLCFPTTTFSIVFYTSSNLCIDSAADIAVCSKLEFKSRSTMHPECSILGLMWNSLSINSK